MESDLRSLLGKMREDIRAEAEAGVPKPIPSQSEKNCLHGKVKTALDREGKEVHSSIFHFGSVSSSVSQFDSVQRDLQNNTQDADVCSYDEVISDDSPCEEGKAPYHPINAPFSPRPQFMRFRRASWSRRRANAKNGDAPYDPEVNLLSQRPKFLRYCPRGDVARLRRSAGISSPQNSHTSSQSNEIRSAESKARCNNTDSPSSKVGEATPTSKLVSDAPFQFRASEGQFEFRVNDKELSKVCDPVSDIHSNNPIISSELASDLPSDPPVQKVNTDSILVSSTTEAQQIVNTQLHFHGLKRQRPHLVSHNEATQSPSPSRPRFKILFLFSLMLLSGLVASIFILADRFEGGVVPEFSPTLQPNEGSNMPDSLSCGNSMCMVEDYLWSQEGILHNQSADLLENDNSDPYTSIVEENFGSGGVHGMHDSLDVEKGSPDSPETLSPDSPETLLELQEEPEEKIDEFGTLDTEHQLEYHNDVDALVSYRQTEQQFTSVKLQPRSFDDGWLCSSYWEDEVLLICRSTHPNVNSEEADSITVDASNSNISLFFSDSCTESDVSDASRVPDDSSNNMSFQLSLSSKELIDDASLQEVTDGPQASSLAYRPRIQDFCTSFKLVLSSTGVILLTWILFVWSKLCKRTILTAPEEEKDRATEEVKGSRPRCKIPVGANENKPIYKATVEFRNVNPGFRASAGAKESRSSSTASAEAKKIISSRAPAEAKESLVSFTSPGEPKESMVSFTSPAKSRVGFTSLAEEKENKPSVATSADTKGRRSSTVSAERKKSGIHMSQDQLSKNNVQEKPATSRSPAPYGSFLTQVADRDRPVLTPVRRSSRIKSKSEK